MARLLRCVVGWQLELGLVVCGKELNICATDTHAFLTHVLTTDNTDTDAAYRVRNRSQLKRNRTSMTRIGRTWVSAWVALSPQTPELNMYICYQQISSIGVCSIVTIRDFSQYPDLYGC